MKYVIHKSFLLCAVAGMSGIPLSMAVAAPVSVTIQDGGDTPRTLENCGELKELVTNSGNVTLRTTGKCAVAGGSGVDTPQAVPIQYGNVSENTTLTIDVNDYPVVVTKPSSVTVSDLSLSSTPDDSAITVSSPTSSGSTISWQVPDVSGDRNVSIHYTLHDASAGTPSSSQINLTVVDNGTTSPPPPPTTNRCVETGNIVCKGPLDWPSGTNFGGSNKPGNKATSNDFEVWEFTYTTGKERGSFMYVNRAGGNPIYPRTAIISETPDESMSNAVADHLYCKRSNWGSESKFYFAKAGSNQYYECPLVEGKHYYLKMKINVPASDEDGFVTDGYYMITY